MKILVAAVLAAALFLGCSDDEAADEKDQGLGDGPALDMGADADADQGLDHCIFKDGKNYKVGETWIYQCNMCRCIKYYVVYWTCNLRKCPDLGSDLTSDLPSDGPTSGS